MGKNVRKFRKIESGHIKKLKKDNDNKFNAFLDEIENGHLDYSNMSKHLLEVSGHMRNDKINTIVKEIIEDCNINDKDIFNDNFELSLRLPAVVESLDKLISLFTKIYNKEGVYDIKEFKRRQTAFSNAYRDFEYKLRSFFDVTESILNILDYSKFNIKSYNDVNKSCFNNNFINKNEFNKLRLFGQIRNMFLHNNPDIVIEASLSEGILSLLKAVAISVNRLLEKLIITHRFRLYLYSIKDIVTINKDKSTVLSKLDAKDLKILELKLYEMYVRSLKIEEGLGIENTYKIYDEEETKRITEGIKDGSLYGDLNKVFLEEFFKENSSEMTDKELKDTLDLIKRS